MQAQQLTSAKHRLRIVLALAGRLIPEEVRSAVHSLTETQTAGEYDSRLLKALAVFDHALDAARERGVRREAILAFRSLAAGEVLIDVLETLGTEMQIHDAAQAEQAETLTLTLNA